MKCVDCPHFRIVMEQILPGSEIWDYRMARCEKHDLVVDFVNRRKINKLECVEDGAECFVDSNKTFDLK